MSLRIWHISDTHGYHNLLDVPKDIDVVIFSGDCSNYRDVARNSVEVEDFLYWFSELDVQHKIMVAGNHDTSIESGFISREKIEVKTHGIKYLYNETYHIDNYMFWGSPFTPSYGEWSFMKKRGKLTPLWNTIPEILDVLITHGPPKGILDLTFDMGGRTEQVGDKELWNAVERVKPKFHLFGHVHNCSNSGNIIRNQGVLKLNDFPTTFINSSVVHDGKFGLLTNHGNIFEI